MTILLILLSAAALTFSPAAFMSAAAQEEAPSSSPAAPPAPSEPAEAPKPAGPPAAAPPPAATPPAAAEIKTVPFSEAICPLIESSAKANGLPVDFFTRLIWRESSFRSFAVSPAGAQGVAQFMPGTAAERGLIDPFDPAQALPKSAEMLRDLRAQFGNVGLAAAAYNAGPRRVQNWLDGTGWLPPETRDHVLIITGRTADEWSAIGSKEPEGPSPTAALDCPALAAIAASDKRRTAESVTMPSVTINVAGAPPIVAPVVKPGGRRADPWSIQLAGNFSQDAALNSFVAMQTQYSGVLSGQKPVIVASRWRHRGTRMFYRVRIGAKTRQGAESLCGRLKAAGGGCLVLKS